MTLCTAWVRRGVDLEELVIASDSRLSGGGGEKWDACPKILILPRTDCAIAFAGVTSRAYPVMLQLRSAIQAFPDSRKCIMGLTHVAGHFMRIINDMVAQVSVPDADKPDFVNDLTKSKFLFAGYDSVYKQFVMYRIYYDRGAHRYVYEARHRIGANSPRPFLFIGDQLGQHQGSISGIATYRMRSLCDPVIRFRTELLIGSHLRY